MPSQNVKKQGKLRLSSSVSQLQGVGQKTVQKLNKVGIRTVYDLVTYFPFRYSDFASKDLFNLPDKTKVSLCGKIATEPVAPKYSYCKFRFEYKQEHETHTITVMFFHKNWITRAFHQGQLVLLYGTYGAQFHTVTGQRIKKIQHVPKNKEVLQPAYSLTQGLKQYMLQKLIKSAFGQVKDQLKDNLPTSLERKYHLMTFPETVKNLQFPNNLKDEHEARRTEKFNELYHYELRIQKMKQKSTKSRGIKIPLHIHEKRVLRHFYDSLPFRLTSGQVRSTNEILLNLAANTQMNRLLQGDVGSGKTIVAALGILDTISAGYQCALMVPTGVLAKQHYQSFKNLFSKLPITVALLTSDIKGQAEAKLLNQIQNGQVDLVIGTDSLIQPTVIFHNLGLAIIDEQHRFGVDQRQALIAKGNGVNALAMTATPIPRTLAITSYGDMDVSVIDTLPKGRKPVKTSWIKPKEFNTIVPKVKELLSQGQQAFLVVPLVEQKSHATANKLDALTAYHKLQKTFSPFKIGLLHGQMDDDEKNQIMSDFQNKKFDLLVSTTVIEVGVDISDATMMIIYDADSFGLATLHQLRGRVGRNSLQSYCWLIAQPKTKQGVQRMQVMEKTNNGFVISQADLKLRGSGDLFGESQSGVPKFKCADVVNDANILNCAEIEARKATVKQV